MAADGEERFAALRRFGALLIRAADEGVVETGVIDEFFLDNHRQFYSPLLLFSNPSHDHNYNDNNDDNIIMIMVIIMIIMIIIIVKG